MELSHAKIKSIRIFFRFVDYVDHFINCYFKRTINNCNSLNAKWVVGFLVVRQIMDARVTALRLTKVCWIFFAAKLIKYKIK